MIMFVGKCFYFMFYGPFMGQGLQMKNGSMANSHLPHLYDGLNGDCPF